MYKQDLVSNNQQGLICHKNQPTSLLYYLPIAGEEEKDSFLFLKALA